MKERNKKILNLLQEQKNLLMTTLAVGSSVCNLLVDMKSNVERLEDLTKELIEENETPAKSLIPIRECPEEHHCGRIG